MKRILLTCVLLTGCTTLSYEPVAFDEDDRSAHREALTEWCRVVGPCVVGPLGDPVPALGVTLPEYTEWCGYLPPAYGDDC